MGKETASDRAIQLPTSLAQERLWFVDRLKPGTAVYNMPVSIRLPSISVAILERCLFEVVRRHEALRTTFASVGGHPIQVISPPRPLALASVELRRYPRHERETRLAMHTSSESRRPFSLAEGPLVRATLYRLAANEHVLLLVLHHIISDGWSIELLVSELGTLYAAFDAALPSPLAPLAIQYADWAVWQRERLEGGALEAELEHCKKQLEGAPTVLDLPTDRPRPELPSYRGCLEPFVMDAELAEGLRALGRRHACTPYMTLLAAFATLLSRIVGQAKLLIGTPVTTRNRPEVESVFGLFVNTVVLPVDLGGAPTVSELLDRVRALVLDGHAHAEVPLERLIEVVQPERSPGRPPLFQVLFSYNASAANPNRPPSIRVPAQAGAAPPPATGTSKFDLSLLMTDAPNGFGGAWEYATDLFDAARIRRLSAQFLRLLRAFVDTPGARVADIPMMDDAEERDVVAFERMPRREGDRSECVHDRVLAQAQRTPEAVAVEAGGATMTYAELASRARALANRLQAHGVAPDEGVGVFLERDANLIVALLAIHAAGGAYVPLDPAYPRSRLAYIASDARLKLVVTSRALAGDLPGGMTAIYVDDSRPVEAAPARAARAAARPANLAYVIYTSGTTGHPKGVGVPHAAVVAMLDWASATFSARELARVLASTSICFDISVFEIFLPLTIGGAIVVVQNVLALASPGAPDVTLINTVPSAMRELVRLWRAGPALRTVNLAGEALPRDLVDRLHERAPGVTIYNLYGPTEATVYATAAKLNSEDRASPSIGRPVEGTVAYVLNERLARVPIGVPGELYLGGVGVGRGYLGRSGLTAESHLPDPLSGTPGARMYRTGDIVSWRSDGMLEYRGRRDHQVKVRGHRIELGEIENALRSHPRVRDVVVVVRGTAGGDSQLVAYAIMDDASPSELDAIARRDLPAYMAPARIVFVGELPRTATGKIDRASLPVPSAEAHTLSRAPATETEATLCQLFAAALERPGFDVDGDFFALGGHSLLATGVVAGANELLGVELPLSAIFEHPTPGGLAAYVATTGGRSARGTPRPEARARVGAPLPLAFAQEGLWFYDRLRHNSALYNLPVILPARGMVDDHVLQCAVDYVVARHDALRMQFETVNSVPVQRILDEVRVTVAVQDLTELRGEERQRRAQRVIERETKRPFDLRQGPLLRVSLVRLAAEENLILVVMHHIVSDGWSADVLRRDLAAAYDVLATGGQPAEHGLPLGYGDYVVWQRAAMTPEVLGEGARYFREQLAGAQPLLSLPSDRPRPPQATFRGGIIAFEFDTVAGAKLAKLAAARGATPHMAHLAVFATLLRQYTEQDDVVIGIPVANRSRPEWRDVVGLFTNALPIRLTFEKRVTFATLLDHVRTATAGAYAHEEFPFDRLVQEVSPVRSLAHHPIFQVMLGFQELDGGRGDGASARAEVLASTGTAKFDLSISLRRSGELVLAVLEYATDLFERESMERVARRYARLVDALADNPLRPLDTVLPLEDEEHAWVRTGRARAAPSRDDDARAHVASRAQSPADALAAPTEPSTGIGPQLAEIWSEVLRHTVFGTTQSFFDVGGHSLAAAEVMARIAETWGVDIPFEQMFKTPTIDGLSRAIEVAVTSVQSHNGEPVLLRAERAGAMPLSFAQERLWFLDQIAPNLPVYNISFPIPIAGPVDAGALQRALERLADRHECLRARFVPGDDGRVQQVFDAMLLVDLPVTDLSKVPPGARRAEAERLQAREARRSFDLAQGPLFRAHLVHLGARDHVLLVTIHHITADARSVDILRRDLSALHESEVTGVPDRLPELPVQFADFAVWQRARLQGARLAAEIAHWKAKLLGAPEVLSLPLDKPRPAEQSYAGLQLPFALGGEISKEIRRLASDEQATPFMVLLAIFAAVMGRWSGAHDLVIGTPIIGRPKRELEELVGFFSNTLPLRMELNGRPTFRALVRHVREVVIEALSHEDLPFESIVQELQPRRSLGHNPLFQVMFAFQRVEGDAAGTERRTAPGSGTSKFDLTMFLIDDDELHGAIEYATDLFESATIERFAAHLRAACAATVAFPDAALDELFPATPADLAALQTWNATTTRFEGNDSLAQALVAAQAARTPWAPAVSSPSETWTYDEVIRRARRLASRLRALGAGPDSRVAIVAEPSPSVISSVLGVWFAGGAAVPLDPSYPAARLATMAKDSGAQWLIGAPGGAHGIPDLGMTLVEPGGSGDGDDDFASEGGSPDQLAYVVFTSGSTGRPKGVAMPHRALVNLVLWQGGIAGRDGARRTLQFASPSFDVFFQEVLLTLSTGGELVIAGNEARRDPALLIELCRRRGIERVFLPFVALRELAETAVSRPPLPELREVITAGEQLQVTRAIHRWFATLPRCRLFNQYGPSETHVVSEEALAADPETWGALPPIGAPIANGRIYVLDDALRPVPFGVPGDIYLGGIAVARGYLNQPARTAERFLPDPHALEVGARMYRAGDRGRWLPSGRVEFLGRSDDQVKIRGYRVEVAEVETALMSLSGVQQAVVAAVSGANDEHRLVGWVLCDDPGVDPALLRGALHGVLPEPMIPAVLVVCDELPRTPNGKVDRRGLPRPPVEARTIRKPASELERIVAAIWSDVLGLEQIGLDDNFFALGGHSLLATRVATRLGEHLGQDVPVRWIFEHPTVVSLATAIAAAIPVPARDADREIPPLARDGSALPSSFAQERLWFLDRMEPGSPVYNLTTGVELPPSLEVDVLRRALNELARRHEALRTVFHEADGRPAQVLVPAARVKLDVVDLSYLPASELDAEARHRVDEERRRSWALDAGPLFRATLLQLGAKGYLLLLSMHHIIADAWSLRILHRDLAVIYRARARDARPSLPALRLQYADFAAWQRNRLAGQGLDDLLAYWRTHLAGAPHRLELPADRPRSRSQALRGGTTSFELDEALVRELGAIGQDEGATLFMTVLALYLELLRRYTRQQDFLVGTPMGARPRPELEDVIGLFVNTLVLRADLSGDPSFRGLVRRVREETLAAYSHADLPFERLVEDLQPRREFGASPLIQVAFVLHHEGATGTRDATTLSGNGTAKFELSLAMTEAGGRLSGSFEYDRDLFEPSTVARMATNFARLARQAVDAPDAPLAGCDILPADEARDVLDRWARGPIAPAEVDLVELVAGHGRRDPAHRAVEGPDGTLSYAQLDVDARGLAAALRALGVVPEVRVGVCLGNSKQLPVAMLAIWRAGGAYVPLDPGLPTARLGYLVRDAGVRVLITDENGAGRFGDSGAYIVLAGTAFGSQPLDSVAPDPDQLAYIVYTSGSTGQPKGVMVTHRGLRALIAAQLHGLGLGAGDRVLKFATPSFDAAIFEITATLAAGATLCLEAQDDLLPSPDLVMLLARREITMVTIPPSSLGLLPESDLPALRIVFVAGEACPGALVARWAPGRRMINGYGPTETTVWATFADCGASDSNPPIGRPVANALVRVVDRELRPVPVGVPGELCIAGPAVARGYLGRPGLTAASFVPDPWGLSGSRMYRTGDLVRWRAGGELDFVGRVDGQIKVRGVRIEPGEIESAIARFPGVAYSAAILREDQRGNPTLVAYVVPSSAASLNGSALRRALAQELPRFLVPSRVMICDELPRTPSGKLDRDALPAPVAGPDEAPTPPQNDLEATLCRIWADVLQVPVGRDDNFFELGGHSLLVTRILSQVRDELGVDLPVRRMFDAPTPGSFCEGLKAGAARDSAKIPRAKQRRLNA